jgi:hypothetical protein
MGESSSPITAKYAHVGTNEVEVSERVGLEATLAKIDAQGLSIAR